jgi:ABC-2 type transport system ATP-binding protein
VLIRRLADQGITVLLSSPLMGEVEELCDRVAIVSSGRVVYEGALDDLIATTAGRYELRTNDDVYAAELASREPDITDVMRGERSVTFSASEHAAAALSVTLGRAGVGIHALVPRTATLEELFFRMTEDRPVPATNGRVHREEVVV